MHKLSVFFFLITFYVNAQNAIIMEGKVIDEQTKTPLPFASVTLNGNKIGTSTNIDGEFRLNLPNMYANEDLIISFVGYKTAKLPIKSSKKGIMILLKPENFILKQVIVKPFMAVDTIKKVIRYFGRNYPDYPSILTGFCRETVKIDSTDYYFNYSEGIIDLYKISYKNLFGNDEVRAVKGRKKHLPNYFVLRNDTCVVPNIVNGPWLGIILDVVKLEKAFLDRRLIGDYKYELLDVTKLNDAYIYVIGFKPLNTIFSYGEAYFQGKLFVESGSLAVVGAKYELSNAGIRTVNTQNGRQLRVKKRTYEVNYVKYHEKWMIQRANVENFYVYQKNGIPIRNNTVFVVTNIETENVKRFPRKEIIFENETFSENILEFDDNFWENDNIIKAEKKE